MGRVKAFAFVRPDGSFSIESGFDDEASVWKHQNIWAAYIDDMKKEGYRVVQVEVEIPDVNGTGDPRG